MAEHLNQALADVLGIEWRGRHVTGFDLCCRVGEIPRVSVHSLIIGSGSIDEATHKFDLSLREFDLDRLCADAIRRVESFVERRAAELIRSLH